MSENQDTYTNKFYRNIKEPIENLLKDDELHTGSPGDDVIKSDSGDDRIEAKGGNDEIISLEGNDRIYGHGGSKVVFAGSGEDLVVVTNTNNDDIYLGSGDDFGTLEQATNSVINGGPGNDEIVVYSGDGNSVEGGSGNDQITIDKSASGTIVTGGLGKDSFTIMGNTGDQHSGNEPTKIKDLSRADGDKLVIDGQLLRGVKDVNDIRAVLAAANVELDPNVDLDDLKLQSFGGQTIEKVEISF